MASLSYFSYVPEVGKIESEPLFDVEFADKKNCIFSFFHIFKIRGATRKTANYQLWVNQPVQQKYLNLLDILEVRGFYNAVSGSASCLFTPKRVPTGPNIAISDELRLVSI